MVSTPQERYSRKKLVKHLQGSKEPLKSVTTSFASDQTSKTTTKTCGAEFIPNYATLTHELRQQTKKNTQWSWTECHTECLKNIKEALSRACSLAYFDPNKHTEIHTDASPVGISAVLSQNGWIVQFASRALSAVEQRYSQTEREALAITWACEHFHIYIFGAPFTVFTDHKPLTSIFNNTRSQLSARIENATIRHDRHIQTRPWQPSWLSQPPSNAPTTKWQRTKNSRGIYKLHPLNLNPQSNDNWWSCNGNGKRQDTHHCHPSHPYQQMAWCRGWHKQSNIPHYTPIVPSYHLHTRIASSSKGTGCTAWSTTKQSCQNSTRHCENHGSPPRKGLVQKHAASSGRKHQELPHLSDQYP